MDLGAVDAAEIAAARHANSDQLTKRLRIGIGRRPPSQEKAYSDALQWESVAGGIAAQWDIASPNAVALRVALGIGRLPPGGQLRFRGSGDAGLVYGPFEGAEIDGGSGPFWSPVLRGDRATVEVFIPASSKRDELAISIAWVSHLFASPADANVESLAKESQACEVDLICRSATDSALATVGKAVARMTFSDGAGGGTSLCTGTLLNTTSGPVAPYFYSANHCISTQASASTLSTHWFYDRTGCGSGSTGASYVQVTGGATLLYNDAVTDVLLLRLNQSPPAGAVYAGWDANALGGAAALTAVHHPAGDWKKVSLGSFGGFSAYGGDPGDSHIIALWNAASTGVTEGGSSGSGIFSFANSQYLLRGGLHGGPSSCSATGSDLRDFYSRFDRAYTNLTQYLNPGTPSCTYSLSPTSASFGSAASSGAFTVTTATGCAWSAASSAGWLTTSSTGSGSGTVTYSVAANTSAARSGVITVGGQQFTASQQAGSGGSTSELVSNGGFESGASGWTEQASGGAPIVTADATRAHSGNGVAWLGGYNSATDAIFQDMVVPTGASTVTLRYWYRVVTTESVPGAWDTLRVQVVSPSSGAILSTIATYSNQDAGGWTQSPPFDLGAFAGQTIRLRFTASTDTSDISSFYVDDVSIVAVTSGGGGSVNYTALWWNPSESGWGVNFNHQGNILFGTLFTYDSAGAPLWLVMPAGALQSGGSSFSGELYRTTGPAFNANPFVPIGAGNLALVGTMSASFSSANNGTLTYTVNGVSVSKSIERQVYGSRAATCTATTASRNSATNYQDLWWNPAESGWGINVTHQDETLFATLFTYDATGRDLWLVMSAGRRQADGSYVGDLYRTAGPPFNAIPFAGVSVAVVGTMRLQFSNGTSGTLSYNYGGAAVTKTITRQVFSSPVPLCN